MSCRARSRCSTAISTSTLDDEELERARIETRVPAWGKELDESILPAEAGLDEHAHLVHEGLLSRAGADRAPALPRPREPRLRVLEVEAARPGDEMRFGDKVVGRVTSAVEGLALGYVRTEVPDGAEVDVAGRPRYEPPPPFLMKLIWPLVSSTAHLTSFSDSIC